MDDIKHKAHALVHQAEACLLTTEGRHRTHGYSMISDQAKLEQDLIKKKEHKLAQMLDRSMSKCVACIKMTAATGRTGFCIGTDLGQLHGELEKRDSRPITEWNQIKTSDMPTEKGKKAKN